MSVPISDRIVVADRPLTVLFGHGFGTTALAFQASGGIGGVDTYDNQFVDTAFDLGVIPLLAAIALLLDGALKAQADRRARFLPVAAGAAAMLLFFDGLGWPSYAVLFWLVIGALTGRRVSHLGLSGDAASTVAPGLTTKRLTAFNGWLRANGNKILIGVLLVGGAIMVGNGIYGLAGG